MKRFSFNISTLVIVYFYLLSTHVSAADIQIQEAIWTSTNATLSLKGVAPDTTRVTIKNSFTKTLVGRIRSKADGTWELTRTGLTKSPCKVTATAKRKKDSATVLNGCGDSGEPNNNDQYVTLAINDLGMHCADLDYQIFSILPPYNVLHSQVIKKGNKYQNPKIMNPDKVDVYYKAATSILHTTEGPVETITTTSKNIPSVVYKSNFWEQTAPNKVLGGQAYNPFYHGLVDIENAPPQDKGLPAPNVERLYLGDGTLTAHQQDMPGLNNEPQKFAGYVQDFPFFTQYPFGYIASELKRHTAEGIPILPVTDNSWENPYPLMKVLSVKKGEDPNNPNNELSSVRTTLPVASEADCQSCHANQEICDEAGSTVSFTCSGIASDFVDLENYEPLTNTTGVPGASDLERVLNTSKINILLLHDAKHATNLNNQRPVVCATCHYSPALDLAQIGPSNDAGKEQLDHNSMSSVMHKHHAETGEFPEMPPPIDEFGNKRSIIEASEVLQETCYACHPGKRAQCMRGAMTKSGTVCQDCHGNMAQIGDDFTNGEGKRVPWAHEPGCQSCHTGDATDNLANSSNVIKADDGIRLLQAYRKGDISAEPIMAINRRFAETMDSDNKNHLYRLSKGHGGVMCEGCHGSTHAIWPNPLALSNDNQNAIDLQGHAGTIIECDTCHNEGSLGLTLKGPHGMHPVNNQTWTKDHKELAEHNGGECKTCHGKNGEGTVLSKAAQNRVGLCKDEKGTLCSHEDQRPTIPKGAKVSCTMCHGNYINE